MVSDEEILKLKQAWLISRSFDDEQAYLAARVHHGQARYVYLDPDGTWDEWLIVAINHPTDVIYGTQCAGINNSQRLIEGYLVPLGGAQFQYEKGRIKPEALRAVFHRGQHCLSDLDGQSLPDDRRVQLVTLIEAIPYWHTTLDVNADTRSHLSLDQDRNNELVEAWIPVQTPDGPGVLLYRNCD
jgi:hypothetical protein